MCCALPIPLRLVSYQLDQGKILVYLKYHFQNGKTSRKQFPETFPQATAMRVLVNRYIDVDELRSRPLLRDQTLSILLFSSDKQCYDSGLRIGHLVRPVWNGWI